MEVKYIDHMGTDLSVVNAARVSFSKQSEWDYEHPYYQQENILSDKDQKLIQYLAREGHWTPFGHTSITVHIKAPIFVARQLGKHQVGMVWNEVSRRYVDSPPELFEPTEWRSRPNESIKQGSSGVNDMILDIDDGWGEPYEVDLKRWVDDWNKGSVDLYNSLIEADVCPEQARMVLPQSMYTEWYWTGNLKGFANIFNLRTDSHTQKETQEVARQIGEIIEPLYPCSWKALTNA